MSRLVIRGLVDGALSSLGVVIGASLSNSATVVLSAGLSGTVANGLSNIMAAFAAEKSGVYEELRQLEKQLKKSLKGTKRERSLEREVLKSGAIDGAASIAGGILPVLPFIFLTGNHALFGAVGVVSLLAVGLGIHTGMHARENIPLSILKMLVFTLTTAGICVSIQFFF